MKNLITAPYIGYVVGNVKPIEVGYGFKIKLIYKGGDTLVEVKVGYDSEQEAEWAREVNTKLLKNHRYVIQLDTSAEEFFEGWLDFISSKLSEATWQAYREAITYINQKCGKAKLHFWCGWDIVAIYKSAWGDPAIDHKAVRDVLKKALKFAKKAGYLSYDLERDKLIFEEWFISDDTLSGSGDIEMTEDGQPVLDISAISEYIKELGLDCLNGKNKDKKE